MKATIYYGTKDIRVEERPMPEIGPKDVLVKVVTCGICGSDTYGYLVHGMKAGIMPKREFGHEYSGVVYKVGKEVKGIPEGLRVVIQPMRIHPIGRNMAMMACGFSQYAKIQDAKLGYNLYHLPDSLSFDEGAMVEPFSVGMHGVNSGKAKPDDKVVVFGAGPVGLSALAGLRALGCKDIVVSDISEFRLAKAKEIGAKHTFNPQKNGNLADFLKQHHGKVEMSFTTVLTGTDLYIDAAGVGQVLVDIIDQAKEFARIVIVALHKQTITINPSTVMSRQMTIQGSCGYDIEFDQVIGFMKDGKANLKPMVTHTFPLSEIKAAFEAAVKTDEAIKVLVHMD